MVEYTGSITIDGIDISTISRAELRSRITIISQDTIQLDGTVRENLIPYPGQSEDETLHDVILEETLEEVGLSDDVESAGGLDVSLSSLYLSQGQKQLLCMARAMLKNMCTGSRLVVMDEPTSSLDEDTDSRIQDLMSDAFVNCTILMAAQRADTLWDANVRLEVENGSVTKRNLTRSATRSLSP